jgi:hypothetical protein
LKSGTRHAGEGFATAVDCGTQTSIIGGEPVIVGCTDLPAGQDAAARPASFTSVTVPSNTVPLAAFAATAPRAAAPPIGVMRRTRQKLARLFSIGGTALQAESALAPASRAPSEAAPLIAVPVRTAFLQACEAASARPVLPKNALDAIRLRQFAAATYPKNIMSRVTHRLPRLRPSSDRMARLKAMPVGDLIRQIREGSIVADRTTLTDVATHHLRAALDFDEAAYRDGVRRMARWEGVHSTVGRGITFGASACVFGIAPLVTTVAKGAARVLKFAGHQVPTAIVNPIVTGILRSGTDVRKSSDNGGIAKLARNIDAARPLAQVRAEIVATTAALRALLDQSGWRQRAASRGVDGSDSVGIGTAIGGIATDADYRQAIADAALATCDAQAGYKTRLASSKAQTWSKGYGMGVNAIATGAQACGIAFAPAIPASLALQALCVPLQWGAGYLDMHTAQSYHFRASLKYGDLLTDAARDLPVDRLQAHHVDQSRLRSLFQPFEMQKLELIREVYTDEIGELKHERECLRTALAGNRDPAATGVLGTAPSTNRTRKGDAKRMEMRVRLCTVERTIQTREADARGFESMQAGAWEALPIDSTIGRCLDDPAFLMRSAQGARKRKPGEVVAQVWQRYKHAYGDGILSAGLMMPGADLALHGGPASLAVPCDLGVATGAATFTAGTGVVRSAKAEDKRLLAMPMHPDRPGPLPAAPVRTLGQEWAIPLDDNGKSIDLSHTGGFDRTLHTRRQRAWRFVKIIPRGLFSSERALYQTMRTRRARQQAIAAMREAVILLQARPGAAEALLGVHAPTATVTTLREALLGVVASPAPVSPAQSASHIGA